MKARQLLTEHQETVFNSYYDGELTATEACRKLRFIRGNGRPDLNKFNRRFRHYIMGANQ